MSGIRQCLSFCDWLISLSILSSTFNWWEYQVVWPLWKTVQRPLQKLKVELPYGHPTLQKKSGWPEGTLAFQSPHREETELDKCGIAAHASQVAVCWWHSSSEPPNPNPICTQPPFCFCPFPADVPVCIQVRNLPSQQVEKVLREYK